ncbi:hypothetical protein [Croceicoccus naphthovorans]|uniref:Uncharacterized protein n=1 Tax=Croceicoccus naphthovorans TaxID=1348774 RepID=A0A0G3XN14_9SPHN|nr:hypothetical protein [Croceicoccus naphthovorans]AKM11933.1 hypothetical protein AB433_16260 [Croceicoccus naphthovorans]MBB3989941.1 hypothetical protein [Croceicoccus naphthovorans]
MTVKTIIAAFGLASGLGFATAPAAAQDASEPKVNQVIVYGDQACPPSTEEEIVVCVRQEDPFRIPSALRQSESKENESWAERVTANREVGATGVGSCDTVGPEGQTGCGVKEIQQAYDEKRNSSDVEMGRLVSEARQARLAEIDETSRLEQERVEALEAEYEARRQAAEAAGQDPDAEPLPVIVAD